MVVFLVQAKIRPGKEAEFEQNWRDNAPMMRANKGHNFRHLSRSKDDPSRYLIYGLWDSEEELKTALTKGFAPDKIAEFEMLVDGKPSREIYEFVGDSENL